MTEKNIRKWVIPDAQFVENPRMDPKLVLLSIGVDVGREYTLQRDQGHAATIVTQEVEDGE